MAKAASNEINVNQWQARRSGSINGEMAAASAYQ